MDSVAERRLARGVDDFHHEGRDYLGLLFVVWASLLGVLLCFSQGTFVGVMFFVATLVASASRKIGGIACS